MKRFSENPEDRITWRTIKSIKLTWDIKWKKILNIWSLWWWYEDWLLKDNTFERLVWLDLPWKYIDKLKKDYINNPKLSFVEADITEELPFENNTFDIVSMWEVLEHLPKNKELFWLIEIDRVLKKWWKLIISTPFADIRSMVMDPVWYFWHRHYTKNKITYLLKEAWFFDFKIEVHWWCYELFTMIIFYFFKHLFKSEIPFKDFFEWKRKIEFENPGFTNIFVVATKINET